MAAHVGSNERPRVIGQREISRPIKSVVLVMAGEGCICGSNPSDFNFSFFHVIEP